MRVFWVSPSLTAQNEQKEEMVGGLEKESREGGRIRLCPRSQEIWAQPVVTKLCLGQRGVAERV